METGEGFAKLASMSCYENINFILSPVPTSSTPLPLPLSLSLLLPLPFTLGYKHSRHEWLHLVDLIFSKISYYFAILFIDNERPVCSLLKHLLARHQCSKLDDSYKGTELLVMLLLVYEPSAKGILRRTSWNLEKRWNIQNKWCSGNRTWTQDPPKNWQVPQDN